MAEIEQEEHNLSLVTNELDDFDNTEGDCEYDYNELNSIRETIEKMNKFNQIEVLKLLNNHKDVVINENKYGVHINLSQVNPKILKELEMFIGYVTTQETYLNDVEKQKESYKNTYFTKDNKDKTKCI
jgi:hypothetical protein